MFVARKQSAILIFTFRQLLYSKRSYCLKKAAFKEKNNKVAISYFYSNNIIITSKLNYNYICKRTNFTNSFTNTTSTTTACNNKQHSPFVPTIPFDIVGKKRSLADLIVATFRCDSSCNESYANSLNSNKDNEDEEDESNNNDDDSLNSGYVNLVDFLTALANTGLDFKTDARLKEFKLSLERSGWQYGPMLVRDFKALLKPNIMLIGKALSGQLVIPDWLEFTQQLREIFIKCSLITGGTVASYIPTLARCSPNYWALSVCSVDGQRFKLGDYQQPFTIQSVSKPVNYALALNELGALVHDYVSQEPSGKLFNDLSLKVFDNASGKTSAKPHNPMVNSGAIVICSLLNQLIHPHMSSSEKFDWISNYYKSMVGDEYLGFSTATFLAERETADRNYAIAYYLRENKCFPKLTNQLALANQQSSTSHYLQSLMDLYFQLCSLEVNTQTLARIACVLANGGLNWDSEQKCVDSLSVRHVLSLCHSCGMYDYSGQFAFDVGLPSKSGVSGCTILIVPNVAGFALYSPPLDSYGNSVRALAFSRALVETFNFHQYENRGSSYAQLKSDPRKKKYESLALDIVRLLLASSRGDISAIKRYFMSGLNMSLTDYDDRSALHAASAEGHADIVEFLLNNCDLPTHEPRDRWGRRPIDDAQFAGHSRVVELLEAWPAKQRLKQQ